MDFSRVKTVVHPDYAYLEDFVRRLPQEEFPIDHVFCDRRNTVVATHEQGIPMVVKKYARPTVFNCFIYTFFRPTKAKRAYRYAMRLERCGVETAAPIGYVHVYRWGIFHTGYFLCRYLPYPTLASIKGLNEVLTAETDCCIALETMAGKGSGYFVISSFTSIRGISCTTKILTGNITSPWWISIVFISDILPWPVACARSRSYRESGFHSLRLLWADIAMFVIGT